MINIIGYYKKTKTLRFFLYIDTPTWISFLVGLLENYDLTIGLLCIYGIGIGALIHCVWGGSKGRGLAIGSFYLNRWTNDADHKGRALLSIGEHGLCILYMWMFLWNRSK
jgi:hypothetical protein